MAAVRLMNELTLKPIGSAVGKLLRSGDKPRGQPDIIIERAHRDSLFASTMLVKPHTGIVIYSGDMGAFIVKPEIPFTLPGVR